MHTPYLTQRPSTVLDPGAAHNSAEPVLGRDLVPDEPGFAFQKIFAADSLRHPGRAAASPGSMLSDAAGSQADVEGAYGGDMASHHRPARASPFLAGLAAEKEAGRVGTDKASSADAPESAPERWAGDRAETAPLLPVLQPDSINKSQKGAVDLVRESIEIVPSTQTPPPASGADMTRMAELAASSALSSALSPVIEPSVGAKSTVEMPAAYTVKMPSADDEAGDRLPLQAELVGFRVVSLGADMQPSFPGDPARNAVIEWPSVIEETPDLPQAKTEEMSQGEDAQATGAADVETASPQLAGLQALAAVRADERSNERNGVAVAHTPERAVFVTSSRRPAQAEHQVFADNTPRPDDISSATAPVSAWSESEAPDLAPGPITRNDVEAPSATPVASVPVQRSISEIAQPLLGGAGVATTAVQTGLTDLSVEAALPLVTDQLAAPRQTDPDDRGAQVFEKTRDVPHSSAAQAHPPGRSEVQATIQEHLDKGIEAAQPGPEEALSGKAEVQSPAQPTVISGGRSAAIASPTATPVGQQLAAAAISLPGAGALEIALSPEELGRVRLTLSPTESGIHIAIEAHRPETLDLIRRNVDDLLRDFRALGYDDVDLSFGDGRQQPRPQETAPDEPPAPQPLSQHFIPLAGPPGPGGAEGLDLRI